MGSGIQWCLVREGEDGGRDRRRFPYPSEPNRILLRTSVSVSFEEFHYLFLILRDGTKELRTKKPYRKVPRLKNKKPLRVRRSKMMFVYF